MHPPEAKPGQPLLELVLTPHRSLPRRGFAVLMAALVLFNLVAGLVFLVVGAWPVIGFLGLDVLLVWLAFRMNYARARQSERIGSIPTACRSGGGTTGAASRWSSCSPTGSGSASCATRARCRACSWRATAVAT